MLQAARTPGLNLHTYSEVEDVQGFVGNFSVRIRKRARYVKSDCNGCGKCVNVCPVEAMSLISANNHEKPKMKMARLNEDICLGFGLCAKACYKDSIVLKPRKKRPEAPDRAEDPRNLCLSSHRSRRKSPIYPSR